MLKHLFAGVLVALTMAGCGSGDTVPNVVGKWSNVKQGNGSIDITLDITKNGDGFLVKRTMPDFVDGKLRTDNLPATYKDGMLQVPSEMLTYSFDQTNGVLTDGKSEYRRLKD